MSKRKAGVNDIIYELDNDDIELSSEDEGKQPKINRQELKLDSETVCEQTVARQTASECINIDCSDDLIIVEASPAKANNGGKSSPNIIEIDVEDETPVQVVVNSNEKHNSGATETSILDKDIVVDSPASNTDLGVVGCENRTPLFTVRFKDKKVAKIYKDKIKAFMLKLIRIHDEEALGDSENETDLELDIWPEDLQEANIELAQAEEPAPQKEPEEQDNFFFIDTDPSAQGATDIPRYRQVREYQG